VKLVTVNCGSSSIKLKVFDVEARVSIAVGLLEQIGSPESRWQQQRRQPDGTFVSSEERVTIADHRQGFAFITAANAAHRIVTDESELLGIGHRLVHGGERFRAPTLIDDEVIDAVRQLFPLAPLHNPFNLLGVEIARERFPHVPQVAIFDTAFHQTLPPEAYLYAVPEETYSLHHVRRYGFHGTSHQYVAREAADHLRLPLPQTNLITLHLGNGASAAAIRHGQCVDTSMGLTPLEGLIMGTRCGDLDPAIAFYLMRQGGMSAEQVERMLNSESGLKGICGTNDMREIQRRKEGGDERAALALEMFCYRVKKYIGAYCAVLGKVDALVFTGGIGENSAVVRHGACAGLEPLGISLDDPRNQAATGSLAEIQRDDSRVKLLVVRTDEELEMARQAMDVIRRTNGKRA
jgi:acetate kinase